MVGMMIPSERVSEIVSSSSWTVSNLDDKLPETGFLQPDFLFSSPFFFQSDRAQFFLTEPSDHWVYREGTVTVSLSLIEVSETDLKW